MLDENRYLENYHVPTFSVSPEEHFKDSNFHKLTLILSVCVWGYQVFVSGVIRYNYLF